VSERPQWTDAARWGACLILALGLHAAGAMVLLAHWQPNGEAVTSGPVILVDFAAEAVAPVSAQSDLPPGPTQPQAEAEPVPDEPTETASVAPEPEKPAERTEIKLEPPPEPEPQPEPLVTQPDNEIVAEPSPTPTAIPPPRPRDEIERARAKERQEKDQQAKRQRRASLASAPSTAPRQARRAAAPAPGAGARDRHALPNWTSQLVARLERYKRYPVAAQARGEHGVAQLAFSVDRNGRVHNARIVRSSGSALLDRATLALVRRAQPLPPPPAAVPGARIPVVVPIRYRNR
jgi:protein TonB